MQLLAKKTIKGIGSHLVKQLLISNNTKIKMNWEPLLKKLKQE